MKMRSHCWVLVLVPGSLFAGEDDQARTSMSVVQDMNLFD